MAKTIMVDPTGAVQAPRIPRTMRYPRTDFKLIQRPWQIQPFMCAPVLPGETMKNANISLKCVSSPINNELTGWFNEIFLFYVKHRDLAMSADLEAMVLDPEVTKTNEATARAWCYKSETGVDFVYECMEAIVNGYFRHEGKTIADYQLDSVPLTGCGLDNWTDSLTLTSVGTTQDLDLDLNADNTYMASEVHKGMAIWEQLRGQNMTDMNYEDWLRTFGVKIPKADEENMPELLRYVKNWTFPTRLVDTSDGSVTAAVQWSLQENAKKDRYFKEPGFIVGIQVCRPKVYMEHQTSSVVQTMNDAFAWIPAMFTTDPNITTREIALGAAPLGNSTSAYTYDMRDLFVKGEQFLNFDPLTASAKNLVALPAIDSMAKIYPSSTDANALFTGAAPANTLETEGMCQLSIASTIKDYSQTIGNNG